MAEHVRGSHAAALSAAKTLAPTSRLGVRGLAQGARLIAALPAGPGRALLRLTTKSGRLYNSMAVDDYPPSPPASEDPTGLVGDTEDRTGAPRVRE
ncbi:hypothetical protein CF54_20845 [Streptomyces sp. Tu 6176]|uniref:hypothetical protein n=1 Tax=Streptomyces sp. Tu 6176 TaxID=1470557 RepID=UPI00044D3E32|nr:hypothetical protein [Streptomyces sp. Tu 6176]EYT81222.1 hypothetical protein CF54_20845 [Streptomyces sp. Tu 6176]